MVEYLKNGILDMENKIRYKRPFKRTKIVATIGPASDQEDTLQRMILAGLDAVRFNFSHSTHEYLIPVIQRIRKLEDHMGIPIAVIGGGVIGCAVAWELSKKHQGVFLTRFKVIDRLLVLFYHFLNKILQL